MLLLVKLMQPDVTDCMNSGVLPGFIAVFYKIFLISCENRHGRLVAIRIPWLPWNSGNCQKLRTMLKKILIAMIAMLMVVLLTVLVRESRTVDAQFYLDYSN